MTNAADVLRQYRKLSRDDRHCFLMALRNEIDPKPPAANLDLFRFEQNLRSPVTGLTWQESNSMSADNHAWYRRRRVRF